MLVSISGVCLMSFLNSINSLKRGGSMSVESLREELDLFARRTLRDELQLLKQDLVNELSGSSTRVAGGHKANGFQRNGVSTKQQAVAPMLAINSLGYAPLPTWDADEEDESVSRTQSKEEQSRELIMGVGERSKSREVVFEANPKPSCLRSVVESTKFDVTACGIVICNAFWIGYQTEYMANHWLSEFPSSWERVEYFFCLCFMFELSLRICAFGKDFFCGEDKCQNWFDFTLVALQLVDLGSDWFGAHFGNLKWVRTLRVARIFRILRVLHFVDELRSLVVSIGACVTALFWLMILVMGLTYIFAIVLTQTVTMHKTREGKEFMEKEESLHALFGSLDRTLIVLFQVVSDGWDWRSVSEPLSDNCSEWFTVVFAVYMVFMLIGLMNIATATVVDSSLRVASEEQRNKMINGLWKSFSDQGDSNGEIDRETFEQNMSKPDMQAFLEFLELDAIRAVECDLFSLVDDDGSGAINKQELVKGCMNLAGTSKSLDLTRLRRVADKISSKLNQQIDKVDDVLDLLLTQFKQVPREEAQSSDTR